MFADNCTVHNSYNMGLEGGIDLVSCHQRHVACRVECPMERPKVPYDPREEERYAGTVLNPELERIRNKHTTLASTGCTRDFCQSGRMTHTDEPRGMYIA